MLQQGCYWRPVAHASNKVQSSATNTPTGSPASDGLGVPSTEGLPSLLPSPNSITSLQGRYDRPVSISSREEADSSPTQASEPRALSAATVTSPTSGEETSVHEVSSLDSQMQVDDGAEDKEEEVATEDPIVEQEEHDEASVWELNDSSSASPSGQRGTEEEVHPQSAESPSSAVSTRSQASVQLSAPLTREADVRKGSAITPAITSAITPASPKELPEQQNSRLDQTSLAEGDCPSSCPPTEQTGVGALGEQVLKGIRRRWRQASLARTAAPSEGVEPTETTAHQWQLELEGPATSTKTSTGTLKAATAKHGAVKSKPAKPLIVLQSIAESIESTPECGAGDTSHRSTPCGHTGLVSLAETPVPVGIKEDPHSVEEGLQGADATAHTHPIEIALGEDADRAGLAEADLTVQSEQRATQELYRFQKHSMLAAQTQGVKESTMQTTPAASQATEQVLPPLAPPVTVYANLPIEWPLARISVYMRHVSVLLRVTLNRRLAELSFRGVDFQHLPREDQSWV